MDRRCVGGDRHRVGAAAEAARRPVVWLVIGIGLFHDRSIAEVVHHLDLVLPPRRGGRGRVSNAAIVQARDQLGAAPLAALFTQTATAWTAAVASRERWHGLAVYCLDGTTLRVPDTPENVTAFGRPPSPDGAGAGYPHVRLVTLASLRHPLLAAAAVRAPRTGDLALARGVWAALPAHAVVILDRGFCSYALFRALSGPPRARHWLVRARDGRKAVRQQVVAHFAPGDALVELRPTTITCAQHPDLPPTLRVRAVRVQRRGSWLFTSLRNPSPIPRRPRGALSRPLGTRARLRRTQEPHARARRGPAQHGTAARGTGSLGAAARLQPRPRRHEPRGPAGRRAALTPELSPRAPRPARLRAHRLAHPTWRAAPPHRLSHSSSSPNGAIAVTRAPSSARSAAISANVPSRSRCRVK